MFEQLIRSLLTSKYVKKILKEQIAEQFKKAILNKKQQKTVDELINLIPVGRIKKETIEILRGKLHEIGSFDYTDDDNSKELVVQEQEVVSPQVKIDTIEKVLDSKVKKYNGFSEKNPMTYVRYENGRKMYRIEHKNNVKRIKNIDNACEKALEIVLSEFPNAIGKFHPNAKSTFIYKNQNFIAYIVNTKIYFDIKHIVQMLEIGDDMRNIKYKDFSKDIVGYCPVKNEYGGYFIREFITEDTMYQIILSSNSALSKSFKKDVSKILCQLRQDGQLTITDSGDMDVIPAEQSTAITRRKRRVKDAAGCEIDNALEIFDSSMSNISCVYLFTIGTVGNLRETMSIDDDFSDECYVVKYGMTENLSQRMSQHMKTFECIDGCNLKLKYYSWINEEYISKAEVDIKDKLQSMNMQFQYKDMVELAIVTPKQLKELGVFYEKLVQLYIGPVNNIISKYEMKLINSKHETELMREIADGKEKLLQSEKEKNKYIEQLYESEKEKNKYLLEIQTLRKQIKHPTHQK